MKMHLFSKALRRKHVRLPDSRSPIMALTLIGAVTLVRNLLFPMFADDYAYSFQWDEAHGGNYLVSPGCGMHRVKNLRDALLSQLSHYRVSGGRSVAHTLDQLFLIHGRKLFNPANTAVMLAQLLMAERLGSDKGEKPDGRMLSWLAACFWFCTPHLAATCQWMTGAFNYLWMGALQSAFVLPYSRRINDPAYRLPPALMAPLGLLAGWSNESGAGAALLFGGLSTLRAFRRREKGLSWMLAGLAGGTAGLAAMLLAPGNFRRAELGDEFTPEAPEVNPDRTRRDLYFSREMLRHHFQNGFLRSVLPQLPMHFPVLLYFTPLGRSSREKTEKLLMLECASLAVPCALLLSPEFPVRAAYPSMIYGLGASAAAVRSLRDMRLPQLKAGLLAVLAVSVTAAIGVDAALCIQYGQRLRTLRAHSPADSVTLHKYRLPRILSALAGSRAMDSYSLLFDIDEDPNDCYNHLIAQYYHVRQIRADVKKEKTGMLKETIRINRLVLRNRIVMPPMATGKADHGAPDDDLNAYYAARANGTALIIVEHAYISPEGMAHSTQLSMADDLLIPAYRKLTDAVHERGAAVFAQLNHAGAQAQDSGLPAISPSGISVRNREAAPEVMTLEDIGRVKECFVSAAIRAKAAGFDGVEIHSAHGYLLNQFYSPLTNRRTDAYNGQTLEGRTRLHAEILRAVRTAVGNDYPVAIRFGACDYMEGGSKTEDIPKASRIFAEAGADLLDISGGLNGFVIKGRTEPGWFSELSIAAKKYVQIPVLLTGGVSRAEEAEKLLQEGAADLIGIGRAMLQDPDWAVKALEEI